MRPFDPRLLRAVPAARVPVAALGLLGVVAGALAIAQAFALSALVVAVVTPGLDLLPPALAVVAALTLRGLTLAAVEAVAARAGAVISTELRASLIDRWLRRRAEARPATDRALVLATEGTTAVEPYVARYLPALVSATVLPIAAIGTMFFLDWISAVIVIFTVPLLPLFAILIGWRTQDETAKRWQALAALGGHFLDVMRGLPTLVNFGRATRQVATIRRVGSDHREATMRTLRIAFLSSAALELFASVSVALVAVAVGLRLSEGHMTLGVGLTAILLAPEAYWPIRRVGTEFHNAADGAEAVQAALAELDADAAAAATLEPQPATDPADTAATGPARITTDQLAYRYPGAPTDALHAVTLTTPATPGLTVVTGPSGAGKTTLLELLAGLRTPTGGTVAAPRAHLVTQRPFLAAGTLRDALTLGLDPRPADADLLAALDRVGLDLARRLADGLDAPLGDDGFGLSAGQRARIALARASLTDAPLLLLDEPTAHLDPEAAERIHGVIGELAGTRRVIAVTHRPGLLALADQHWEVAP